ncbi:hypothetical protein AVEN_195981-1 [Araneus ventricosus]|uniref:DUF4371 domain-containing protein n=1 Tax=Araneus ventricosus TaxID=182803 RepID=A0A4Y2DR88_ARAVE|nr:hypothetical protein AVEN_195981-1 [Araneus ventricosus]
MKQHLDRYVESASRSYLSHRIQDELISDLAKKVRKEIINFFKKAKYFIVSLDCTPDVSHQEQLSVISRYVNVDESEVSIHERFICFEAVKDSTGKGLSAEIESILEEEELYFGELSRIGYDNGANMRGLYKGVQALILQKDIKVDWRILTSKAQYMTCGGHNLNLVLGDISKSSFLANSFLELYKAYIIYLKVL